jgi:hypothetical protein
MAKFKVDNYSDFIKYSINGTEGTIYHQYGLVNVVLPSSSAISAVKPVFEVEEGATVYRDDYEAGGYIIQQSGESVVDFTNNSYAYYRIDSSKGSRYVTVAVAQERLYQLSGSVSIYEGDELLQAKDKALNIYGYNGDKVATVTTDAFGNFTAAILYSNREAGSGFYIQSTQEFGGKYYKVVEAAGGNISGNRCLIYPDKDVKLIFAEALSAGDGFYQFRGKVVDGVTGDPLSGVEFHWDGVDWGSPSGTDGSFLFDFDDNWHWSSYGFYAHKAGYTSANFTVQPSTISMKLRGYIDLGTIKMMPVANNNPVTGSLTAVPNYTRRGNVVEITVNYMNRSLAQPNGELRVNIPAGVHVVDGSFINSLPNSTPDITDEGNIKLIGNMPQGVQQKLKFWVEAESGLADSYFNIDAEIASQGSGTYSIGSAFVAVSDITVEVPPEVGVEGADSALFTVKGETSALPGYKINIKVVNLDTGDSVVEENIDVPLTARWYSKDVRIPGAANNEGAYLVVSSLKDTSGVIIADDSKILSVKATALRLRNIHLTTPRIEVFAKTPVTNSSYVPASIFVNSSDYAIREGIELETQWADISNITSAAFTTSTQYGTKSFPATIKQGSPGAISATFPVGSFKGYGAGKIYLTITKKDNTKETFLVAVLSMLIDPSGYVFNKQTKARIEGATVTLEHKDAGGNWVKWDGTDSDQVNPQKTNSEGEYGWFVLPGVYRVLVTATGYQDYNTETSLSYGAITVLPPREDVYIAMQPVPTGGGNIGGGGGGSSSSGGGGTVTTPVAISTLPAVIPPDALRNPFTDVNEGDWFYGDVNYAYTNGLFTGTSATTFSPNASMTRGMLVTVLGRLHGVNSAEFTGSSFDDVSAAQYYAPYIEWAKSNGIVLGVGGNLFAPDAIITRQDLAVIIIRYTEYAKLVFPTTLMLVMFADGGDIADYADNAIQTLVNGGILNGKPGNMFDPKGNATRAEVAAVLHRFADQIAKVGAATANEK